MCLETGLLGPSATFVGHGSEGPAGRVGHRWRWYARRRATRKRAVVRDHLGRWGVAGEAVLDSGRGRPADVASMSVERIVDPAFVLQTAVLMLLAYLAGSVPVGVLVARLSGGTDPRTVGSGRTGGTNALRALGRKWAAVVVIGDLAKGAVPVLVARWFTGGDALVEALCGACAVAGAIWSVFAGFRSGRGVGTGVGTMLVIQPLAVVLTAPVFIGAILLTRYVSLGSLLGSAAMFPAMLLFLLVAPGTPLSYVIYVGVGAAFIWLAHSDNIDRLLHGTERKFDLGLLVGRRSGGG